ncbi:adenylate kinase chloroplastic-like [Tripterygium wilfordii]|uniref:adenylate kinase n=2 Tax=Tripterygium wilfordii TaxID=458696 RepID=A0A7J7CBP9_TRIWF|nr:adenylate kinase chloroplastic-like [Tripterygium wilfordii]
MASSSSSTVNFYQPSVSLPISSSPNHHHKLLHSRLSFAASFNSCLSFRLDQSRLGSRLRKSQSPNTPNFVVVASAKADPLKVMISGAPASGKGTQCELIKKKYGLVHIAAGDLLRAEIASASENGRRAKEYMEKGQLVPNEIVVMMVKERLLRPDAQQNGWLLDGYPRSLSQATALKEFGFQPDLFIVLDVPEEILVDRVVGRRSDPVTGKIYHLKYSPPETEEIAARLTQRFDDTEEKVKLRLQTHNQNVEAVLSLYEDITVKVNGTLPKQDVFAQIDSALSKLLEERKARSGSLAV